MSGIDYLAFRQSYRNSLMHSPKGTTWKNHKYIKKENGRYIYKVPNIREALYQGRNAAKGIQKFVSGDKILSDKNLKEHEILRGDEDYRNRLLESVGSGMMEPDIAGMRWERYAKRVKNAQPVIEISEVINAALKSIGKEPIDAYVVYHPKKK